MSLTEYRRKRQFGKTREPEPGKILPDGQRAIFVVQLHHASRRHYDFRLQIGDALKSWAVPKGPSLDPSVKRMAVEVEDHPIDYADFEGDIPKGHYGGGHVAQFDKGVWSTPYDAEAQLAKGHLRFELFGEKLKGEWHLVRSGKQARQPQWLLFKEKDQYASHLEADDLVADVTPPGAGLKTVEKKVARKATKKPSVLPKSTRRKIDWPARALKLDKARKASIRDEAFAPQLAKLVDKAPEGEQWLHELKWDGYRLVTTIKAGKVRIWSRNGIEWTDKLPEIRAAIEQLGLASAAFDGELIAGSGTQADFNTLQATLSGEQQGSLSYVLFDLLHIDGIAIEKAPLIQRKGLLELVLKTPVKHLAYSSHIPADGAAAFALAMDRDFEGLVSKRVDGAYHAGRGDDWRKTKRMDSDEFAVVGYSAAKGSRSHFGSLLLARPDKKHGWSYAGRVGSGFSNQQILELAKRMGSKGHGKPTVHIPPGTELELRDVTWFAPMFVVEVFVRGISNQGVLRQPSLKAVRPDKSVADLQSDVGEKRVPAKSALKKPDSAKSAAKNAPVQRLSSPTKIIYPDDNISKQEVADYYLVVMDHFLPEIAGRPLSIIRCPNGAGKSCFFQKHHTPGLELVDLVPLKEEAGNNANYLVANSADAIMELVQFNGLEFHPWGAHADNPDVADRIVFDLDPGPGVSFDEVKRAAVHVRDLLKKLSLQSFLRTTGGKGLHVVVPLNPGSHWDLVKRFARGFAEALAASEPTRFVSVATLKARPKKIFIDYLRNGRGATAVASYSLRARTGAPVAMPLPWSALPSLKRADAFTLKNVPKHLKQRRKDPWQGIDRLKQDLSHLKSIDR